MCGVYYLWDGERVLYVGQSVNVEARVRQHRSAGIDFAGYFCDECNKSELNRLEAKAIIELRPKLNETRNLQP